MRADNLWEGEKKKGDILMLHTEGIERFLEYEFTKRAPVLLEEGGKKG